MYDTLSSAKVLIWEQFSISLNIGWVLLVLSLKQHSALIRCKVPYNTRVPEDSRRLRDPSIPNIPRDTLLKCRST